LKHPELLHTMASPIIMGLRANGATTQLVDFLMTPPFRTRELYRKGNVGWHCERVHLRDTAPAG
jgi:hypothetical protein